MHEIRRGITLHQVMGGYERKAKVQIETILTEDDFSKLIDFMHRENIRSFMSSDTVSAVYGLWNKKSLLNLSQQ